MRLLIVGFIVLTFTTCKESTSSRKVKIDLKPVLLDIKQAEYLASLPIHCIQTEYPYKSHLIISKAADLGLPKVHHPAFYGCFDWHSAVHGHWSLVYLLKSFPKLSVQKKARKMLGENLTAEKILKEVAYFGLNSNTKSFERTYGWAWVFKLAEELQTWEDPDAKSLGTKLRALS